jgi:hypothetical protein
MKRKVKGKYPELGVVGYFGPVEGGVRPIVFLANLVDVACKRLKLAEVERYTYTSLQTLVADGWEVD